MSDSRSSKMVNQELNSVIVESLMTTSRFNNFSPFLQKMMSGLLDIYPILQSNVITKLGYYNSLIKHVCDMPTACHLSAILNFRLTIAFPATMYNLNFFNCPKPGTCTQVGVVVLLLIYCYMFIIFALDQVDCRVLCIVSQFAFRGLLQFTASVMVWTLVHC